ncbi:phosphoadenylyl-sulfate reductase [Acidiluteibacter ferrifornacis]|jgi:phosphoadenosine phosphosulfate reductase|uniref:Adenosine 5'-phosphosulfate reductase n=1 Tax=Acidiluteibacter ferrifornacis TaxID=2692424 RepID=A0A6N9NHI5_9FLAO|nr:phosphoadenylyl-sulfate reductase [Acidiluteibacter ferrifornacis]MBR9830641.1 phosphoadenylyl-sulfate reductase [bacterium]NBG64657.1 phosphoadenylyl-sulfate reductase [Acidiluteibacter ferrifornacis]
MKLDITAIKNKITFYREAGKRMFLTSSFQTHSIPLLHIISQIDNSIPIYYLNTGFLFPETISFKDELQELLNMPMIGLTSGVTKINQMDSEGKLLYSSDPDYCCFLNKTQPMEPILASHDIWINGIRADQSAVRKNMKEEQPSKFGCTRYHPILNWDAKMIHAYRKEYNLPAHPLEKDGYLSIGCAPCTRKYIDTADERNGRWYGLNKTECGLHTDLATK